MNRYASNPLHVVGLASLVACGCASAPTELDTAAPKPAEHPAVLAPQGQDSVAVERPAANPEPASETPWHPLVREIAASHASWGLVDNQFHWAPGLCAMPAQGVQHLSVADAGTAHAEKVFVLHALDSQAYWRATDAKGRLPETLGRSGAPLTSRADVLQVLVKESFVPRPLDGGFQARLVPARKDDVSYGAGDPIGLFVMAQLRDVPAGTDAGWIYATVAPDGEITAAGDLEACRGCHATQADRVFGMPLQWK